MEKESFLETCIVLGGLDKESIIKTILAEKFNAVIEKKPSSKKNVIPEGCDLLVHTPSHDNFVEYAYQLCTLKENKDVITRHLLSLQFDASVEAAVNKSSRVRTRLQSNNKTVTNTCEKPTETIPAWKKKRMSLDISSESGSESSVDDSMINTAAKLLCNISKTKLPSKLNLFTVEENGCKKNLNTMSEILPKFFPGSKTVWPGIYKQEEENIFILLVIDNGRFKNNWKSCGTQNKLTWFTSQEDTDKSVMDKIVDDKTNVHIVRKRNGEMRYMGKRVKTESIDKTEGSCVLYVA